LIFSDTGLEGVFLIQLDRFEDERGFFARSFCRKEFEKRGLNPRVAQCNISFNRQKGTLRGMHFQAAPFQEAKLIRCTGGAIHDVVIDLRPGSRTYRRHYSGVLTPENRHMIYVPEGFAHGFLTLEDRTEVFYQMSEYFAPENAQGIRWNDPAFEIPWPAEIRLISERDRSYPDFFPE